MLSRKPIEINAGSMADIAFLLLIFFLVTTTMDIDTGISRKLPPLPIGPPPVINERNILKILVNKNDKIMVEDKATELFQLRALVVDFVLNPTDNQNLSEKKIKQVPGIGNLPLSIGIVSLKNDRGTSYKTYVDIQNEITAAYTEIRNEFSLKHFGLAYDQLTTESKKEAVKKALPLAISEAEPENIGGD